MCSHIPRLWSWLSLTTVMLEHRSLITTITFCSITSRSLYEAWGIPRARLAGLCIKQRYQGCLGWWAGTSHAGSHFAGRSGGRVPANRQAQRRVSAKPRVSEDLSPLELLRQENELLRKTINSADKDIEELEAQLQVIHLSMLERSALQLSCCFQVPGACTTASCACPRRPASQPSHVFLGQGERQRQVRPTERVCTDGWHLKMLQYLHGGSFGGQAVRAPEGWGRAKRQSGRLKVHLIRGWCIVSEGPEICRRRAWTWQS